jgi:putative DNA primase/helicase
MSDLTPDAQLWAQLDYSVIPISNDGSKRPAVQWKKYQVERASDDTIWVWFSGHPEHGLGVVTGAVSLNLEMLELEGRAVREGFLRLLQEAMDAHGQTELWALLGGYVEHTPSGGLHLYYRVLGPARPNTKLARRPSTPEELAEHPQAKIQVLIETRGEGGMTVVAPTPGTFHASGQPWSVYRGSVMTIPTITEEQRDTLYAICISLDRMPVAETPATTPSAITGTAIAAAINSSLAAAVLGGTRPGDDFNTRAEWGEILQGWKRMRPIGAGWAWQRPGKTDRSISATTGTAADGVDRLFVFSSSTDFETETPYSKFAAYAHLHHGDNYTEAAKDLLGKGYGVRDVPTVTRQPRSNVHPIRPDVTPPVVPITRSLFDGALALDAASQPAAATASAEKGASITFARTTDAGNAEELINRHGTRLRYDCDRGRWMYFSGHQWHIQPPGGGIARELAKETAQAMPTGNDKALVAWQHRSLTAAGVSACLTSAETIPGTLVHTNEFDANPYLLGTPGGVVELMTGTLRDGEPGDMVSRSTTATPAFGPYPQLWTDFLDTTFSSDQTTIRYIQQLFGLALIGEVLEHILPLFYGKKGHNGKSTLVDTALHLLGISDNGYATSIPSETLMVRKHESHSTELAVMAGRRLIVASELEDGQRLAEARIKLITGNDVISARFLYGQPFTFKPSHLVLMVGNNKPKATTGGPALWRRLRSVPFLHQMPEPERDLKLPEKLVAHGGYVLAWMIAGAVDFQVNGLQTPAAVLEATEQYQREEDSIGRFIDDRIHIGSAGSPAKLAVRDFRRAYEEWCQDNGDVPLSPQRITQELDSRFGVQSVKGTAGARFYTRLTLYADEREPDPRNEWVR